MTAAMPLALGLVLALLADTPSRAQAMPPGAVSRIVSAGSPDPEAAAGRTIACRVEGWLRPPLRRVDLYLDAPPNQPGSRRLGSASAESARAEAPGPDSAGDRPANAATFRFVVPADSVAYDGRPHRLYAVASALEASAPGAALTGSGSTLRCAANVRRYGARADGRSDDAPAIQAALRAAVTAGDGAVVFFPAGTYGLGSDQGGNLGLFCNQRGAACFRRIPNAILVGEGEERPGQAPPPPTRRLTLAGEVRDGRRLAVLRLLPGTQLRVIAVSRHASDTLISQLVIDGNGERRLAAAWPDGQVVDALIAGQHTQSLHVLGVEIRGGIEDGAGCWACRDFVVADSRIVGNGTRLAGGAGVAVANTTGGLVRGNEIIGNSTGVWVAYGASDVRIMGNTIGDSGKSGLAIGGTGGLVRNVHVEGNTVTGSGAYGEAWAGIAIVNAGGNNLLRCNRVADNTGGGIFVQGLESAVPASEAPAGRSTGWRIERNLIQEAATRDAGQAIRFTGDTADNRVDDNLIEARAGRPGWCAIADDQPGQRNPVGANRLSCEPRPARPPSGPVCP